MPSRVLTPLERFIQKTENDIESKERQIQQLLLKEEDIRRRLDAVKAHHTGGTLCHKCHLRLGHTARTCSFERCSSVFHCGEERFHAGELNLKQLMHTVNKLKNEKLQLERELEGKKVSKQNVEDSVVNRIESSLLEVDPTSYFNSGVKNWNLLRKHVFVLQKYCPSQLNGRIPPKHNILHHLNCALQSSNTYDKHFDLQQSRTRRKNPAKESLESFGIQFPSPPMNSFPSSVSGVLDRGLMSRLLPSSKEEEDEQLKIALSASIMDPEELYSNTQPTSTDYTNIPSIPKSSCTSTSSTDVDFSKPSNESDREAANALMSLWNRP